MVYYHLDSSWLLLLFFLCYLSVYHVHTMRHILLNYTVASVLSFPRCGNQLCSVLAMSYLRSVDENNFHFFLILWIHVILIHRSKPDENMCAINIFCLTNYLKILINEYKSNFNLHGSFSTLLLRIIKLCGVFLSLVKKLQLVGSKSTLLNWKWPSSVIK